MCELWNSWERPYSERTTYVWDVGSVLGLAIFNMDVLYPQFIGLKRLGTFFLSKLPIIEAFSVEETCAIRISIKLCINMDWSLLVNFIIAIDLLATSMFARATFLLHCTMYSKILIVKKATHLNLLYLKYCRWYSPCPWSNAGYFLARGY